MAMTREQLLQAFGALANTQALRRQEEQKKVAPQVVKPVVKPVWNESKVPVTPQLQQRNLDIAKKVVSTTPGAFAYGVGRGISMPVTAAAKLMGYQESPEEAAVRTLAESKRLTSQMDASKGMGQPNIIQGRSIAPEMVGKVVGSILPFSKAEAAAGALFPQIAGAGIKNTAIRGAISGGALQGIEEAGQGKRGMELAGSVALGTALGAAADVGLGYLAKALKAGRPIREVLAEPETLAQVKAELNLPESAPVEQVERSVLTAEGIDPEIITKQLQTESIPAAQGLNIAKISERLKGLEPQGTVITPQKATQPQIPQTQPATPTFNKIAPQTNMTAPMPTLSAMKVDNMPSLTVPVPKTKVEPQVRAITPRTSERQATIEAITEPGQKERGFSENLGTDLNRPQQTIDSFNDDPEFYTVLSNKTTLDKAQSILDKGYESALKSYDEIGRTFEAHKVPLGIKLSDEAVARGDFDTSRRILADLAEELTSAGQFSQAANILRRSKDPEAATLFLQRQINRLNKDGSEQYGKKWAPVGLMDEELQAITAASGDQAKYDEAMEAIYNRIAQQIPSSNREKFDAWRRMAMLLNPKTHVRNIVGNTLMKGLERVSDSMAQVLESAVRPAERTRAIGWSADKGLVKTVQDSWEAVKPDLTNMSKYEISGLKAFNREKPIFKTKAIEFMNNLSKSTLEAEDVFFMKSAYQDALGQYMKANKLTAPNANAIDYAKKRALEATFRSANALASFIENIKRRKGPAGIVAEAAIPFSKTPANILMRGIDYSPFGLIKLLASKDKTPAEIIDVIAKGATGSSLVGLGMLLANNGWARGDYTTAKKEGLAELTGEQPMSIITPQGSYTFDWAQPAAVPLAMGIAIQENLKKKNPDAAKIAIEAAAAGGDAIINMSMLQNLKDLMGGGFESPTENVLSLPKQYIEQAFPSFVGQLARISDPKQRSAYADTEMKKALNQIKSKTPGARQTLEPKIDILGREVSAGSLPTRIIQNLLSPGSIKKKGTEPVVVELSRLYESGRDTRIIPRVAPKTLERTVKGNKEEFKLTAPQLTTFQKSMGRSNEEDLRRLFSSTEYRNADDTQKAKLVKKIVEDNYDEEKEKAFEQGNYY